MLDGKKPPCASDVTFKASSNSKKIVLDNADESKTTNIGANLSDA